MSNSDLFQTVLTFASFIGGLGVSWYFFRVQQMTDFHKLIEKLNNFEYGISQTISTSTNSSTMLENTYSQIIKINRDIEIIRESTNVAEYIDISNNMEILKNSVNALNRDVNNLSSKIIGDVRIEQHGLIQSVQREFSEQSEKSRLIFEKAIQKELSRIIPEGPQQYELSKSIADLTKHILDTMGNYQRIIIEQQSTEVLKKVEQNVVTSITKVSDDIATIKSELPSLLSSNK